MGNENHMLQHVVQSAWTQHVLSQRQLQLLKQHWVVYHMEEVLLRQSIESL